MALNILACIMFVLLKLTTIWFSIKVKITIFDYLSPKGLSFWFYYRISLQGTTFLCTVWDANRGNTGDNEPQPRANWLDNLPLTDPCTRCERRFHERRQMCLRQPKYLRLCSPSPSELLPAFCYGDIVSHCIACGEKGAPLPK